MHRALLALLVLSSPALCTDDGWRRIDLEDGILVEARDVESSPLHEVRASTHSDSAPETILAVLWHHEEHPRFVPYLRHLEVLEDAGDERLLYEQIAIPVLKDRDVVLRVRRSVDPTTGVVDVTSRSVSNEGPAPTSSFVRVKSTAGHWHLVPVAGGGTDVTYTIRTEVGGSIPAWIVNRAQRESVPHGVRVMLERAAQTLH